VSRGPSSEADGLAIEVRGLRHQFGSTQALAGVDLEVRVGETFGLLGPNGAGKTTALSILATRLKPVAGEVSVLGRRLPEQLGALRREVGLAPQELSFYPGLSGLENLLFFGRLYGLRGADLDERCEETLERVGLGGRRHDRAEVYSGGMQRRLNLACALVHRPRLLLLDEPTVGVDPQSRENLLLAVREISEKGTTIVITTHYIEEAERVCDRLAIVDAGRIIACGTGDDLLATVGLGEVVALRGVLLDEADPSLRRVPGLRGVEHHVGGTRIFVDDAARGMAALTEIVSAAGVALDGIEIQRVDLERVFVHLTGRALRD